jgi:hypothetical protein
LTIKQVYDSRTLIPLAIVTIFCFGILMMHPFNKGVNLSSTSSQINSNTNGSPISVNNAKVNSAQPIKTTTNEDDPIFTPPDSVSTLSPTTTETPQPAASSNSTSDNSASSNSSTQSSSINGGDSVPAPIVNNLINGLTQQNIVLNSGTPVRDLIH